MKSTGISEIKKELSALSGKELIEICLRLARYKKENKELLSYLLFEAHDEDEYIKNVKIMMKEQLSEMNQSNTYLAKKTIRKVLRTANKYIKYSKNIKTEIELRIYFCFLLKNSGLKIKGSTVISNIYERQQEKAILTLEKLHEDLKNDYTKEMQELNL
jgi:DNA repair protein RadC